MWEYVKGSEADFTDAPKWATHLIFCSTEKPPVDDGDARCWASGVEKGSRWQSVDDIKNGSDMCHPTHWHVIAERRKVEELQSRTNDDKLARDVAAVATLEQKGYEWCGGALWKPPIGPVPDFILKEQQAFDTVQRPAHYNQSGIECIDAIAAAVKGKSGIEAVLVGNVIKYLWRYELKGGLESLLKAQWYLEKLIQEKTDDKP